MNTVDRIKQITGIDILDDQNLVEGGETVVTIEASFPVLKDGTRFALNVLTPRVQPSTDYDERMLVLADALQELADNIRTNHSPEWGPDSPGYDEMGQ
jgi:hypothetical protein